MVVTGAKSEDDSRLASRKYARIVQKLGFDAKFSEFKIQPVGAATRSPGEPDVGACSSSMFDVQLPGSVPARRQCVYYCSEYHRSALVAHCERET